MQIQNSKKGNKIAMTVIQEFLVFETSFFGIKYKLKFTAILLNVHVLWQIIWNR